MIQLMENMTKTEKIIAALKAHVLEGNLKTGTEFPPEKELALQLGVGRFSLREAMRVAEAQGLIEISRGRRAKVAAPSASAAAEVISLSIRRSRSGLLDLAEARYVLETHIAWAVAKKITAAEIRKLEKTVQIIGENPNDLDLCVEQDLEFHGILVRATRNVVFEIMLSPLTELLRESRRESMGFSITNVVAEHGEIIAAMKARSPGQAARCMRRHLEMTISRQLRRK